MWFSTLIRNSGLVNYNPLIHFSFNLDLLIFRTQCVNLCPTTDVTQYLCYLEMKDMTWKMEEKVRLQRNSRLSTVFILNFTFLVIMPPSALDQLTRLNIEYPMLFKIVNKSRNRSTHAGVLEFVADEGKIYIPFWVISWLILSKQSNK